MFQNEHFMIDSVAKLDILKIWMTTHLDQSRGVLYCRMADRDGKMIKRILDGDKCLTQFTNNGPGNRWYWSFMSRNENICLRNAHPCEKKRANISVAHVDQNAGKQVQCRDQPC
jgi:hypothetical protein